ncbi:uncharacterized protein LOC108743488 [Agrilus planipennis]|uniref:Uncharacterized protein LOC108743488 n=1 Tax=Agrilus planipennis TaxID=224129 RepID=A0A1W4XPZ0_AGRPL|nr:uncharacterized protein LOC108743488 [Agrilus planipennis]
MFVLIHLAIVFHLQDIRWERTQFLSKSFLAFLTFNIITYGLLFAEVLTTQFASRPSHDQSFYMHIFNGCYAVLLFIVVVFFLVYGVEVYFKVRGAFIKQPVQLSGAPESEPLNNDQQLLRPKINNSQLHQSRVGLISQAFMLIIIVGFLFSETLSEFWKTKVPVVSRNWHDVLFRVVEIGVAIWFPAVLWNCMSPNELWILNPRKLLAKLDNGNVPTIYLSSDEGDVSKNEGEEKTNGECWICYDADRSDPLIRPCACTGDVSSVHHECLRRWLMESSSTSTETTLKCKVCNCPYNVETTTKIDWERGFTAEHWGSTALFVTCLSLAVAGAWITIQLVEDSYIRMISASIALMIIYVCIRFLGQNTLSAYKRAKIGSVNIGDHVTTISGNVTVTTMK